MGRSLIHNFFFCFGCTPRWMILLILRNISQRKFGASTTIPTSSISVALGAQSFLARGCFSALVQIRHDKFPMSPAWCLIVPRCTVCKCVRYVIVVVLPYLITSGCIWCSLVVFAFVYIDTHRITKQLSSFQTVVLLHKRFLSSERVSDCKKRDWSHKVEFAISC